WRSPTSSESSISMDSALSSAFSAPPACSFPLCERTNRRSAWLVVRFALSSPRSPGALSFNFFFIACSFASIKQTSLRKAWFLSAGHQYRELRLHDDVPGAAAKDHLADPALRIGALQQQIGARRHRLL